MDVVIFEFVNRQDGLGKNKSRIKKESDPEIHLTNANRIGESCRRPHLKSSPQPLLCPHCSGSWRASVPAVSLRCATGYHLIGLRRSLAQNRFQLASLIWSVRI